MKRLLLLCTLLWCCLAVKAQTYPVTVVPTIKQPAPIYFSSYADAGVVDGPLRVQILLNDLNIANREIRLKTYVEGNGINFQSNAIVNGASPLFLEGGIPLVLTSSDLAPYFEYSNITGISAVAYGQPIPEGSYQFCFEVYDAVSGNRISQKSCANTYIFQNEPPFLVMPQNKTALQERNPQNIVFQWTPRHINVTNVEYELSLVEIWDNYVDPQAAFLSSRPVFQTTTRKTTYVYGPTDPMLLPNKRYAWRVQAKAKQGAEDIGVFKNNGYSEIFWFTHTSPCKTPQHVTHEVKGMREANIYWDDFSTDIPEFTVRYREKTSPSGGGKEGAWFTSRSTANWVTLWDLRPGTVYEYQVAKNCELVTGDYSPVKTFTTFIAEDESGLYNCGIPPDIDISNQTPLAELKKGDVFKAGDFPVKVMQVSGSNGRFTGKGYVSIPYLNSVKVAVEFTNVFVNADNQLAEGMVITKYDPTWGNIGDVDGLIDSVESIGDVFNGGDDITEIVDFEIKDVKVENGKVIITGTNGKIKEIDHDEGDDYTITDSKGNQWSVNENGNVSQSGQADNSPQLTADNTDGIKSGGHEGTVQDPMVDKITSNDITVVFRSGEGTRYALDKVDNQYETDKYPKIESSDGSIYFPVHKAVVDDRSDVFYVDVVINNPEISIDSINIKTSKGTAIQHELDKENNTFKITVKGNNPYHTEEAVVTYRDPEDNKYKIAGIFYMHHIKRYDPIDVKIVPVGSSTGITNIEEQLNKIYKQVGVTFNVSVEENFDLTAASWDDNGDGVITYNAAGFMSDYPKELKNIIKAYKSYNRLYDDKAYYLFVMDNNIKVSKPLGGFMPKTRQWGFLFEAYYNVGDDELESKGNAARIAAHELGHGAFTLEHPFGENMDNAGIAGNWLMDYGSGTDLAVPDWQMLSDPSLKLYLFQDEEEGQHQAYEYMAGYNVVPGSFINHINGQVDFVSFISPAGKIISLPKDVQDVTFLPSGELLAFTINENDKLERYVGALRKKGTAEEGFAGYLKKLDSQSSAEWEDRVYKDYYSYNSSEQQLPVYIGKLQANPCGISLYKKDYPNTAKSITNRNWNDAGYKEPINKGANYISGLNPIVSNISSPEACDFCDNGQEFYEKYISTIQNEKGKESLYKISKLICVEGEEYYNALISQIEQLNNDEKNSLLFKKYRAIYDLAVETFWDKDDAWEIYANRLIKIDELLKSNTDLQEVNTAELFFIIDYCSIDLLETLTIKDKTKILQFILTREIFITEGNYIRDFFDVRDEESLLIKLISSVKPNESKEFFETIQLNTVGDKNVFAKMFQMIDNFGGSKNFTLLNQVLFVKFIEAEGGLETYINKYVNNQTDYKWHKEVESKFLLESELRYQSKMEDYGNISFSADFKMNYVSLLNMSVIHRVDCLEGNCTNVWKTVEDNGYAKYIFENFVKDVGAKEPDEVVVVEFTSDYDELGIEKGTKLPIPAFFFHAIVTNNNLDVLKEDIVDGVTLATSAYAGGALIKGVQGLERIMAIGTLFFNTSNTYVMTDEVRAWIETKDEIGKGFLAGYKFFNMLINVGSVAYSSSQTESFVNFMALYFDSERDYYEEFGKPFKEKFPEKYNMLMDELNRLK